MFYQHPKKSFSDVLRNFSEFKFLTQNRPEMDFYLILEFGHKIMIFNKKNEVPKNTYGY